jgi:hypothetical protein
VDVGDQAHHDVAGNVPLGVATMGKGKGVGVSVPLVSCASLIGQKGKGKEASGTENRDDQRGSKHVHSQVSFYLYYPHLGIHTRSVHTQ